MAKQAITNLTNFSASNVTKNVEIELTVDYDPSSSGPREIEWSVSPTNAASLITIGGRTWLTANTTGTFQVTAHIANGKLEIP
jgi:hypothetical protein